MAIRLDVHTHILPEKIPDFKARFGYGGFPTLQPDGDEKKKIVRDDGKFFRAVGCNCYDPQARVGDFTATGVDMQLLSTVPIMFSYWARGRDALVVSQYVNDEIAKACEAYPDRYLGLGTVPLQEPELAIAEMERCVDGLGLLGIEIGSHVNHWNLDHESLFPFFEAAAELGAAIFVHPWDMMGKERMPKYWLPWLVGMPAEVSLAICSLIFGGVLEKLPKLRVCFAHGGGAFAGTVGRIDHGFKVRPDLCAVENDVLPSDYLGKFFVDSLVHDAASLELILNRFGKDKVLLGSDYPFPLGEQQPGKLLESINLSDSDRNAIFASNACQWLGIKPSRLKGKPT